MKQILAPPALEKKTYAKYSNQHLEIHNTYTLPVSMFCDVPSIVCVYAVENEMIT